MTSMYIEVLVRTGLKTWYDTSRVHSPYRYEEKAKAGTCSSNIRVHMVAMYDAFQAVLGFLCRYLLRRLPDDHTQADADAAYNEMVQRYTENLVIRGTLVIKRIIFCSDHLQAHVFNKQVLLYLYLWAWDMIGLLLVYILD